MRNSGRGKKSCHSENNDSDAIGYEVTMAALADASDNTHYEYIATTN